MSIFKYFLYTLVLLIFFHTTTAQAEPVSATKTITVQVNGLVCDFCAVALEKTFKREEAISSVEVDLDTKLITLSLKPNTSMDDATITQHVSDAGYNIVKIER